MSELTRKEKEEFCSECTIEDLERKLEEVREAYEFNLDLLSEKERKLKEAREIVKAVAHIGIDWGYGKFELNQDHIDKARKLYEEHEQLKEQGDECV